MAISEFHESTIIKVQAYFGFDSFDCQPSEISTSLGVIADYSHLKDSLRSLKNGKTIKNHFSTWSIESKSTSKDINIHLRQLLERLKGVQNKFEPRFGKPSFSVLWKGNYLYAGSGPFYEVDVLKGISELNAELYHDIYQVDEDE